MFLYIKCQESYSSIGTSWCFQQRHLWFKSPHLSKKKFFILKFSCSLLFTFISIDLFYLPMWLQLYCISSDLINMCFFPTPWPDRWGFHCICIGISDHSSSPRHSSLICWKGIWTDRAGITFGSLWFSCSYGSKSSWGIDSCFYSILSPTAS